MGQAEVIRLLKKYPNGLTTTEMNDKLKQSRSAVGVAVKKLREQGDISIIGTKSVNNGSPGYIYVLNKWQYSTEYKREVSKATS